MTQDIFPLSSLALWSKINRCYWILFSNVKQKKLIICSVISIHVGPVYIETRGIICLVCDSFSQQQRSSSRLKLCIKIIDSASQPIHGRYIQLTWHITHTLKDIHTHTHKQRNTHTHTHTRTEKHTQTYG